MHRAKGLSLIVAAAAFVAGAFVFGSLAVPSAHATPAHAQQTGKACGYCHVNKAGGGALTAAGKKYKANGNKL